MSRALADEHPPPIHSPSAMLCTHTAETVSVHDTSLMDSPTAAAASLSPLQYWLLLVLLLLVLLLVLVLVLPLMLRRLQLEPVVGVPLPEPLPSVPAHAPPVLLLVPLLVVIGTWRPGLPPSLLSLLPLLLSQK